MEAASIYKFVVIVLLLLILLSLTKGLHFLMKALIEGLGMICLLINDDLHNDISLLHSLFLKQI